MDPLHFVQNHGFEESRQISCSNIEELASSHRDILSVEKLAQIHRLNHLAAAYKFFPATHHT
jgi:hypothetical protein